MLVLALALGFAGLLSLPLALRPVLPWFGGLLTGTGGSLLTLAAGGSFIWIGWGLFRLRRRAWWATGISAVAIGVSTAWTVARTERAAWYRALDYPERQIERLLESGEPTRWPAIAATIAFTLATLGYLGWVRRHFVDRPR
ncbi:MAG: hypothetical protein GTN83_17870 [Acidobacteria bacterium]|nr:hypothetical protein [Acidobacteriota bacterium]